jgi:hypothetical protein
MAIGSASVGVMEQWERSRVFRLSQEAKAASSNNDGEIQVVEIKGCRYEPSLEFLCRCRRGNVVDDGLLFIAFVSF